MATMLLPAAEAAAVVVPELLAMGPLGWAVILAGAAAFGVAAVAGGALGAGGVVNPPSSSSVPSTPTAKVNPWAPGTPGNQPMPLTDPSAPQTPMQYNPPQQGTEMAQLQTPQMPQYEEKQGDVEGSSIYGPPSSQVTQAAQGLQQHLSGLSPDELVVFQSINHMAARINSGRFLQEVSITELNDDINSLGRAATRLRGPARNAAMYMIGKLAASVAASYKKAGNGSLKRERMGALSPMKEFVALGLANLKNVKPVIIQPGGGGSMAAEFSEVDLQPAAPTARQQRTVVRDEQKRATSSSQDIEMGRMAQAQKAYMNTPNIDDVYALLGNENEPSTAVDSADLYRDVREATFDEMVEGARSRDGDAPVVGRIRQLLQNLVNYLRPNSLAEPLMMEKFSDNFSIGYESAAQSRRNSGVADAITAEYKAMPDVVEDIVPATPASRKFVQGVMGIFSGFRGPGKGQALGEQLADSMAPYIELTDIVRRPEEEKKEPAPGPPGPPGDPNPPGGGGSGWFRVPRGRGRGSARDYRGMGRKIGLAGGAMLAAIGLLSGLIALGRKPTAKEVGDTITYLTKLYNEAVSYTPSPFPVGPIAAGTVAVVGGGGGGSEKITKEKGGRVKGYPEVQLNAYGPYNKKLPSLTLKRKDFANYRRSDPDYTRSLSDRAFNGAMKRARVGMRDQGTQVCSRPGVVTLQDSRRDATVMLYDAYTETAEIPIREYNNADGFSKRVPIIDMAPGDVVPQAKVVGREDIVNLLKRGKDTYGKFASILNSLTS
jgi:hypothetical protein